MLKEQVKERRNYSFALEVTWGIVSAISPGLLDIAEEKTISSLGTLHKTTG